MHVLSPEIILQKKKLNSRVEEFHGYGAITEVEYR